MLYLLCEVGKQAQDAEQTMIMWRDPKFLENEPEPIDARWRPSFWPAIVAIVVWAAFVWAVLHVW